MFEEKRYEGKLTQILTAEQILGICPWLWAINRIWAEGIACQSGSIHIADPTFFDQELSDIDDWTHEVSFLLISNRIYSVVQVPRSEIPMPPTRHFRSRRYPDPAVNGRTIAERIISAMNIRPESIKLGSQSGNLTINHIVVASPGPVDRSTHYFIYHLPKEVGGTNLLPALLESARGFVPLRFKEKAITAV